MTAPINTATWRRHPPPPGGAKRSQPGRHFIDTPDDVLSLINPPVLRSPEERWGYFLDPLRFRANLNIDGARPWEEFHCIGDALRTAFCDTMRTPNHVASS